MFLNGCEKEKWRRRVLYCGYGLSNLCLKSWLFQNRSIRSSSIRKRRKQKYYMFHAIYIYIRMNGVYTLNNSRQTIIYRQYILGSNIEKVHILINDLSEKYLHCFSYETKICLFGNCLQTTFVQTLRIHFVYLLKDICWDNFW